MSSPKPLPADCARTTSSAGAASNCNPTVTVSSSTGTLAGTTIVGEGERSNATATGELVAACWLAGPDTLPITNASLKKRIAEGIPQFETYGPQEALIACMKLVTEIVRYPRGISSASACRTTKRLAVNYRKGRIVSVTVAPKAPAGAVRYTCSATGGVIKLGVTAAGAKGGLRGAIGPKLDVGVVRSAKAPRRTAKLTLRFS